MAETITIESIIKQVKSYNPASDSELIIKAFLFAQKAHEGQKRDSGEPYINHPLAVANILSGLQIDDATIIGGLLHDVVEDTDVSIEDIENEFDSDVRVLVEGVTKLSKLEFHSRQEAQAENLRKMFMAMAKDIRIILIKLADRLHNMRTIKSHYSFLRQKEISEETLNIFAPLAHRLGMFNIKSELEDLSIAILEPERIAGLESQIAADKPERNRFIEEMCSIISERLKSVNINAEVSGRSKNLYSIYNKMRLQQKTLDEIFDLNAVRVIVDTIKDCYGVLGVIHTMWKPIPGRFKDYIAMPKQNLYQSIHTTVIVDNGMPLEVQIRTKEMHRTAEYGIAAHWRYKEGRSDDDDFEKKIEWLRQMLDWQQELGDAQDFMEKVKGDLFDDNIYVFSPKGDVYELPTDSGPIDFAYRVHTQVGHQCVGAKVNNRLVPLDTSLNNGDIVEILTAKGRGPSRDWLLLARTQHAKNKIRQWFRKEKRDENISFGRELLDRECKKFGLEFTQLVKSDKLPEVAKRFQISSSEDLYAAIGAGVVRPDSVVAKLREGIRKEMPLEAVMTQKKEDLNCEAINVKGVDNLMVRVASCCKPLPGDAIVGYITRGRGVSVHRTDCSNIQRYQEQESDRLIEVSWGSGVSSDYQVEIEAIAINRDCLVMDIVSIMADTKTPINSAHVSVDKRNNQATVTIKLEVKSLYQLDYLIERVRRVKDVFDVHRIVNKGAKKVK